MAILILFIGLRKVSNSVMLSLLEQQIKLKKGEFQKKWLQNGEIIG